MSQQTGNNNSNTTATPADQDEEESLRNQLRSALMSLKRREPLDPTYKRLLMNGVVSTRRPVLPKDKVYKRIPSNLRERVQTFVEQTQGKDPFDKISQRQPLQEEHMRAALTLREAKKHEQKSLLDVTLAALPRKNGVDATTRRRHLEGIVLGLQSQEVKHAVRARTPPPTAAQQTENARKQAELERQIAQAKAREDARKKREEDERKKREEENMKRKISNSNKETPQQALYKIYYPIFKKLWEMEFPQLGGTNPFRIVIDRENCASLGAPNYFDIIKKPMNLSYVQKKVDNMEYNTLQLFFQDIELIINNALLYNSDPTNPYRKAAQEMKKLYRKIAKKVVLQLQLQKQQAAAAAAARK